MSRKTLFSSYFLGMLLSCGLFAIFFLGVNARGDWQKYYVDSYVDRLIASPYGVTYPEHIPAVEVVRGIKLEIARRRDAADCYLSGSSHHMLVNRSNLAHVRQHCPSFVNMASPAGNAQDFVTAATVPFTKGIDKKITFYIGHVGFDNIDKKPLHSRSFRAGYRYIKDWQRARDFWDLPEIFSYKDMIYRKIIYLSRWQYFLYNLGFPDYGLASMREIGPHEDEIAILPDGSQRISQAVAERQQPISHQCSSYIGQQLGIIEKSSVQAFEAILERLSRRGMNIVHLITPQHPDFFSCDRPAPSFAQKEIYLWSLARRAGHTVLGSFDPRPFSIEATDFYPDRAHLKPEGFHKIAAPLPAPPTYAQAWYRLACPDLPPSMSNPSHELAGSKHSPSCSVLPWEEGL